jgi:hypothetical protein
MPEKSLVGNPGNRFAEEWFSKYPRNSPSMFRVFGDLGHDQQKGCQLDIYGGEKRLNSTFMAGKKLDIYAGKCLSTLRADSTFRAVNVKQGDSRRGGRGAGGGADSTHHLGQGNQVQLNIYGNKKRLKSTFRAVKTRPNSTFMVGKGGLRRGGGGAGGGGAVGGLDLTFRVGKHDSIRHFGRGKRLNSTFRAGTVTQLDITGGKHPDNSRHLGRKYGAGNVKRKGLTSRKRKWSRKRRCRWRSRDSARH